MNSLPPEPIAAIVLAAGMSQRMGRLKPLLPFGDRPMLARVLANLFATQGISPIIVVTGHAAPEIRPVLQEFAVQIVHNAGYALGGMLSSVQAGVRALPADHMAFFLVLGDQPMVHPDTFRAMLSAWRETDAPIVLPTQEGKRGHPVLFAARCAPEILSLPPGATLKAVVKRHAAETLEIPVSDPAVVSDVDTPEDYERALRLWQAR